ncbi:MAG TPA: beta-galactosidase, partial [Chthonomonadales bacterium]|nr:beta-galactosidase [Chthonomonadales bacterium]
MIPATLPPRATERLSSGAAARHAVARCVLRLTIAGLLLPLASSGAWAAGGGLFPPSSAVDFRFLLEAPAGRHGFLTVDRQGRFAWPDGRRARFWGVNISSRSLWVDAATIETVADALARSGANLVRLEAIDNRGGLLEVPGFVGSRVLDPAKLAALDRWVAALRSRGIYVYLNLLDFRTFHTADGVPEGERLGRGARPYAFLDRRLIDLQKEYATALLGRRNEITGLRLVDDPALAMVEICNENGFFLHADTLDDMVEPYRTALRQAWCQWLTKRYGDREALRRAWGAYGGGDVLQPNERLTEYSVQLPNLAPGPASAPGVVDVRRAPRRVRDGVLFLYELQRAYFAEMRDHLRSLGLRVPITASVSNDIPVDLASVAAELDFTAINHYADHPAFEGEPWVGPQYYGMGNPLRSAGGGLGPVLARARWSGKPLVVREWAVPWPNPFRVAAMPEVAAYARLHDVDAVLLFGYQIAHRPEVLSDFDHQADPAVWGMFGAGAAAFLRGDVSPSAKRVRVAHSPHTLFRWPARPCSASALGWLARVDQWPPAARAAAGIVVPAAPDAQTLAEARRRLGSPQGAQASTTGQIVRDPRAGRIAVSAPRFAAVAGELPVGRPMQVGPFSVSSPSPMGAVIAVSLDGRPLASSGRVLLKMVTRAVNTGQRLVRAPAR